MPLRAGTERFQPALREAPSGSTLNHPNFNLPGRTFGASNFGAVQSAHDPGEMQFALKFDF
jgi:hypothetical protein